MTLTSEKKEILLCAIAQLMMKYKEEEKILQELYDEVNEKIIVVD